MHLFGPVLPYDLVRVARRGRYIFLRVLYAAVLLALLYLSYHSFGPEFSTGWASPKRLAAFAEHFFHIFLLSQFVLVCILTPAYVGDAIAEEKQRGTLDYLLTTELHNREIVLGKLLSRLASVVLFLMVGLPILSLTQLFGGVSLSLLLGGFAALLLMLLSVGAISICLSVHLRTPRDAILLTYLLLICYGVGWALLLLAADKLRTVGREFPTVAVIGGYFMDIYRSGNPVLGFYELEDRLRFGGNARDVVVELLARFGLFHGFVTLGCLLWAVSGLRRAFQKHKYTAVRSPALKPADEKGKLSINRKKRPIGDSPMIWKELHIGRGMRMGPLGKLLAVLLALACLAPAIFTLFEYLQGGYYSASGRSPRWYPSQSWIAMEFNQYVRQYGTLLCSILILAVGVRAASSIGIERDKQTLDGLLASPLKTGDIIFAKWWGSLVGMRGLLGLILFIWALALCTGGLSPLSVLILAFLLAVYTSFMASLGLWFAVWTRQTLRAVMATLMGGMLVGSGAWVCVWMVQTISRYGGRYWWIVPIVLAVSLAYAAMLGGLLLLSAIFAKGKLRTRLGPVMTDFLVVACPLTAFVVGLAMISEGWDRRESLDLMATGLTPPAVLAVFTQPADASLSIWSVRFEHATYLIYCVVGIAAFALGGGMLGLSAADRFRRTCGRVDVHAETFVPERRATMVAAWGPELETS